MGLICQYILSIYFKWFYHSCGAEVYESNRQIHHQIARYYIVIITDSCDIVYTDGVV